MNTESITIEEAAVRFNLTVNEVQYVIDMTDPGSPEFDDDTEMITAVGIRHFEHVLKLRADQAVFEAANKAKFLASVVQS